MITLIWQDIVLIGLIFAILLRWAYTSGYKYGKQLEKYETRQREIEKSGDYFCTGNTRVPYPPRPSQPRSTHIV